MISSAASWSGTCSPRPPDRGARAAAALAAGLLLIAPGCHRGLPPQGNRRAIDGLGRSILVASTPRRVVSLAPSVTDSLFALGFGDRVVGVTDFCTVPRQAGPIVRVGGMLNPSLETIRALRPDLLIGTTSGNDPSLAAQAAALGLPLYTVHTPDVEATLRSLEAIADLLGDLRRGRVLVTSLRRRLEAVRSRLAGRPRPRVLFLVWGDPLVVPGRPAFLTDALRDAGAASVTDDAPGAWPAFDLESAIARAPEVILTTPKNRAMAERLSRDPAWAEVPAVRRGRILIVSEAIEQPGPEVVDGIEEVARRIDPQAFLGDPGPPAGEKN